MNFGKYAILKPVTINLKLEPEWTWSIKPITTGEELQLSQFLNTERVAVLNDGTRIGRPATNLEVACREIALSFAGTNIPGEDAKPILSKDATIDEVEAVLKSMPHDLVMELWEAVGEAVPTWGPAKPKKKASSAAPSA